MIRKSYSRQNLNNIPRKRIPFSQGLDKIPTRYLSWLALLCLALGLFFIVFGFYIKYKEPERPYHPYVVTPYQVSSWLQNERNMLLVELSSTAGGKAPLLINSWHVGPISFAPRQMRQQAEAFVQTLPQPRPWIICYSETPEMELISTFLGVLNELDVNHIYALAGSPENWAEFGLIQDKDQQNLPPLR